MGKAYMELGQYEKAFECYQSTLSVNPINTIARRNISRIELLLARGDQQHAEDRQPRQQVDQRFFITEAGKTMITVLTDVARGPAVDALSPGERVDLHVEGRGIQVIDADGTILGRIEPKVGQRLSELINGGNRYVAAVVQADPRQIRILIRETYQDHSQRGRTSFPGKLADASMYEYLAMRYDYEADDLLDEEEPIEVAEMADDDVSSGDDDTEIRLDSIEPDMGDDDDTSEE
jgi:tetratricopeptide (TPR) repeat protein